ncbi:hypothetical protein DVH24_009426 [Malus domestica]|uniref:Uncharacterized protein n=1 Tax=Malus domestica TaxID=3750 RepID=A0A498ITU7_MALDO|nr:hypothetical protein DVH24_009426 [Malus domestica]
MGEKEKRLCFRSISPKTLSLFSDFWFSSPLEVGMTTMNATAPPDVIQVIDYQNGSDSDTNIDDNDDAPAVEFYQPVSAVDSEYDEDQIRKEVVPIHSQLHSNGVTVNQVDEGISSLQLNNGVDELDRWRYVY